MVHGLLLFALTDAEFTRPNLCTFASHGRPLPPGSDSAETVCSEEGTAALAARSVWTTKANNQSVMLTDVMSILDIMSRGGGWSIHKPICMCFNAVKHVTIPATT